MSANNTIVDHYAPNWLPFFSRNGEIAAGVEFKVECGICNKRLAISEPADDDDIEDYAILPCQHAFGYDCIKMWKRSSETANCPTCREKLWHSSCEHDFPLRRLKFDGTNVGKAVAECSVPGGLPPLCRDCVSGRRPPRGYDNGRPRRHGTVTDYYEDGASGVILPTSMAFRGLVNRVLVAAARVTTALVTKAPVITALVTKVRVTRALVTTARATKTRITKVRAIKARVTKAPVTKTRVITALLVTTALATAALTTARVRDTVDRWWRKSTRSSGWLTRV
ncbi:hypothetical protein F5B17DRAFT_452452 [Nemania serpens]|nr:hypothetical protein F5B17DRAFT_452452 [Nemania serpens]